MNDPSGKIQIKSLLVALGLPRGVRHQGALAEWIQWDGFPQRQENGWPVEDVRKWIQANGQKIAQYWTGIELASGRVRGAAAAVQLLAKGQGKKESNDEHNDDLFRVADTQTGLAQKLQAYYGNRIRIVISPQKIQDWRRGRNMPAANIPAPPACDGKYWDPKKWVEWFDNYLLKHYLRQEDAGSVDVANGDIHTFKETVERAELEHRLKEIEIENGKWVRLDVHKQTLRRLGVELNQAIDTHAERELARTLREAIAKLNVGDELHGPLIAAIEESCRAAADGLRKVIKETK